MARPCDHCGGEIAWKSVYRRPGESGPKYLPYEPKRDASGAVEYATHKNGKGTVTRRAVPSDTPHVCGRPKGPHVEPPAPEPTQAPTEIPPTYSAVRRGVIRSIVRSEMKTILDEYGVEPKPQRIEVVTPKGTYTSEPGEIIHKMIPRVIDLLSRGQHVYCYGPAGSGKTHGLTQAATMTGRTLGKDLTVIPFAGITYGKMFGQPRPDGSWMRAALAVALEEGHVVVADEFDRTLPAVAAGLNSVLENRRFTEGARTVEVSPNFVMLANGNTDGRGATRTHTSAQPLDLATLARFAFVHWPYDEDHEDALVRQYLPAKPAALLLTWIRGLRECLKRDHIDTVWSGPREAMKIARDVKAGVSLTNAVDSYVWRGLDPEIVQRLTYELPLPVLE